ncbi:MAG: metallophosphoesterase, partial [Planctomycetota bacterium]
MTAYLRLQLLILAGSGILTYLCWRVSGLMLPENLRDRPLPRLILASPFGIFASLAAPAIVGSIWPMRTSMFLTVAIAFHALWLWGPLLLFGQDWRNTRSESGGSWLARLLFVALPLVGIYAMFIEPNRLVIHRERLEFAVWPEGAEPLRLVHLSDLQTTGIVEREHRALAMIAELEPDLIVVTGDLVAGPLPDGGEGVEAARHFLGKLEAPLGVFVVDGHCEPEEVRDEVMRGLDVTLLRNDSTTIELESDRRLTLVGFPTSGVDVRAFPRTRTDDEVVVVLSHLPDLHAELMPRYKYDLHLAGHTHGGQISVPFFGPPLTLSSLPRETARGTTQLFGPRLHVNAGIGMEGGLAPRIRFLCPPEICVL